MAVETNSVTHFPVARMLCDICLLYRPARWQHRMNEERNVSERALNVERYEFHHKNFTNRSHDSSFPKLNRLPD